MDCNLQVRQDVVELLVQALTALDGTSIARLGGVIITPDEQAAIEARLSNLELCS